ncbi:MAG: hypothetical protein ABWW65_03650 [Thermoprotei archaeon]
MGLREDLRNDPWQAATRFKDRVYDLAEVIDYIRSALRSSDQDELYNAIEFIRALRSQLPLDAYKQIFSHVFTDKRILSELVRSDNILKAISRNYNYALGLLTLLESLVLIGMEELQYQVILELLKKAAEKLSDDEYRELYRAMIHGPIRTLGVSMLARLLREMSMIRGNDKLLMFKSELLVSIPLEYPAKVLAENESLVEGLRDLLRNTVEEILLISSDKPDIALESYKEIRLFITLLMSLCGRPGEENMCGIVNQVLEPSKTTIDTLSRVMAGYLGEESGLKNI